MANWDKMTESKFRAVKILLKGGASVKEAAEYMQMSTATIYIIKNAENLDEYNAIRTARDSKRKQAAAINAKEANAKEVAAQVGAVPAATLVPDGKPVEIVKEIRSSVTIQATHYMEEQQRKTNELLTQISAKLAFIVDELCGVSNVGKK